MGCTSSIFYTKRSCTHFNTFALPVKSQMTLVLKRPVELTSVERHTVRRTWPILARDLHGNGLQVLLKIFEMCPETKALFSVENVRHSQLARNVTIKAHGARFIGAINATVDKLDEFEQEDAELGKLLFSLGQQHKHFKGFKPEYFVFFYEALMWQWGRCMGDEFTNEVSDTWSHVFFYLIDKLKEGYFSKEDICDSRTLEINDFH